MNSKAKLEKRIESLEEEVGEKTRDEIVCLIAENDEEFERMKTEYLKTKPEPGCFVCLDQRAADF